MKEKLTTYNTSTSHLAGKDDSVSNYKPLRFTNCLIEYELRSKDSVVESVHIISVPLSSLDPSRVRVRTERNDDGSVVRNILVFPTFKNRKLIQFKGTSIVRDSYSSSVFADNKTVSQAAIEFDDVTIAQRFAKAMIHAVQLCGGKSEPF